MATYQATARSNYFRVRDHEAFAADLTSQFSGWDHEIVSASDGSVGVLDTSGEGFPNIGLPECGWTYAEADSHTPDTDEVCKCGTAVIDHPSGDLLGTISRHLIDEDVAVLIEAGHAPRRCGVGYAVAINSHGDRQSVNIDDIYELAASRLGGRVTEAIL